MQHKNVHQLEALVVEFRGVSDKDILVWRTYTNAVPGLLLRRRAAAPDLHEGNGD